MMGLDMRFPNNKLWVFLILVSQLWMATSFLSLARVRPGSRISERTRRGATPKVAPSEYNAPSALEVVLFGVGDLRVRDHEGLTTALEKCVSGNGSMILPLFVFDKELLSNIPGASIHTALC